MQTISITQHIHAPAEVVWQLVASGGGVDRWLPLVTSCRLEGTGPGARRVCTTAHGPIEETLELVDHATRLFRYRVDRQAMLPVSRARGTFHVADAGPGASEILWFLEVELIDGASFDEVRAGLGQVLAAGCAGLERLARGAR